MQTIWLSPAAACASLAGVCVCVCAHAGIKPDLVVWPTTLDEVVYTGHMSFWFEGTVFITLVHLWDSLEWFTLSKLQMNWFPFNRFFTFHLLCSVINAVCDILFLFFCRRTLITVYAHLYLLPNPLVALCFLQNLGWFCVTSSSCLSVTDFVLRWSMIADGSP